MKGKIARWKIAEGYGFARGTGFEGDAFLHISQLQAAGFSGPDKVGTWIEFDLQRDTRGRWRAENVRLLDAKQSNLEEAWASKEPIRMGDVPY